MADIIIFIIIAIIGAVINSESKKRRARPANPSALGAAPRRRARTIPGQLSEMTGGFAELVAQFDQQREQSNREHAEAVAQSGSLPYEPAEGIAMSGSLPYESTEGADTPGHDHGFTTIRSELQLSIPLQRAGDHLSGGGSPPRLTAPAQRLRQAIIMAEVLGKPVSQRRRI